MENNYQEFYKSAQIAVDKAEAVILKYFHEQNFSIEQKADNTPVTAADKAAERIIKEHLHKTFPSHGYFGEEEGDESKEAEFVWTIDPIDGTKNFVRGLPLFSTELAMLHNGKPVVGISNFPILKQRAQAAKGIGAFVGTEQITVSKIAKLENAYVSHGGIKHFDKKNLLTPLLKISYLAQSTRGFGDSWSFQQLAQGKIDVSLEAHVRLWDIAAQSIIIEEAGGTVTDIYGKQIGFDTATVLASNGLLHQELLDLLC
ncbi:MAG: inositol-phosphate phosphatase [bacterium]|nr:inositol-phosphate phosphatase [bacterium]